MTGVAEYIYLIIGIAVLLVGGLAGLVTTRLRGRGGRTPSAPPAPTREPQVGDDAEPPRDTATRTLDDAELPPETGGVDTLERPLEQPESPASRLVRLRQR